MAYDAHSTRGRSERASCSPTTFPLTSLPRVRVLVENPRLARLLLHTSWLAVAYLARVVTMAMSRSETKMKAPYLACQMSERFVWKVIPQNLSSNTGV